VSLNLTLSNENNSIISRSSSGELSTSSKHHHRSNGTLFLSPSLKKVISLSLIKNDEFVDLLTSSSSSGGGNLASSLTRCLECSYENILDTCSILLNTIDNSIVIRTTLGIITEVFFFFLFKMMINDIHCLYLT
jgi:hypothetical protein